jgi:hypothetical protein
MSLDFINVGREVFLPKSLNYMGLLGSESESKDFGQVTIFYDDITLVKDVKKIQFQVTSEMASISIQLEQEDRLTYSLSLQSPNEEKKKL